MRPIAIEAQCREVAESMAADGLDLVAALLRDVARTVDDLRREVRAVDVRALQAEERATEAEVRAAEADVALLELAGLVQRQLHREVEGAATVEEYDRINREARDGLHKAAGEAGRWAKGESGPGFLAMDLQGRPVSEVAHVLVPMPDPALDPDWTDRCHGCGAPSATVFCQDCYGAGDAKCPHGEEAADCGACQVAGDLAFDAMREDALEGRR